MTMTRLWFLLKAQTQYGLHSPYLYRLYREVLFATLTKRQRRALGLRTRSEATLYKLSHSLPADSFLFMERPHSNEAQWRQFCQHPQATATIDLYHSGIVLLNPHLSKQHYLLR